MDKYQETFNTWNNIAALYQEKFMGLSLYNDSYRFLCTAIVKPGAKLLDIGCGPGNITQFLLSQRPDFDILGIDIAPNMIELARQNNPGARFEVMDSRHISQLNSKFDGIVVGFCLPYLSPDESKALIQNAYDLLNENGILYLSFVEGDPENAEFKVGSGGRVYFYYHRTATIQSQLLQAGFALSTSFTVPYKTAETTFDTHVILTATKK